QLWRIVSPIPTVHDRGSAAGHDRLGGFVAQSFGQRPLWPLDAVNLIEVEDCEAAHDRNHASLLIPFLRRLIVTLALDRLVEDHLGAYGALTNLPTSRFRLVESQPLLAGVPPHQSYQTENEDIDAVVTASGR